MNMRYPAGLKKDSIYPSMKVGQIPSIFKNDLPILKKKKKKLCFSDWIQDFFSSTSMHGLSYVVKDKAGLTERFLWICVFATGLVVSAYLSFIIYYRWETSPVIISVGNLAYPVEEADFPAVSVCNSNKVSKAGFQKFLEEIKGKDDAHILKSLFRGLTTFQRRNEEDTKMMEMTSQKYNISMDVFIQKMMVARAVALVLNK
ncbi:hypothetical protein QYM36_006570, partial [Artemia franciscana]